MENKNIEDENIEIKEEIVETEESPKAKFTKDARDFRSNKRGFSPKGTFARRDFKNSFKDDLLTHMVSLRAVSKTTTGGRQRSFSVLMIAGNEKGLIGCGTGKSADITEAIKKAERRAKNNLIRVELKGTSIAHNVRSYFCGTQVIVRKVSEGTGLKAGGVARKVLTLAGIKDISCKCIGKSTSNHNVVYALMDAFKQTMKITEIANSLNKSVKELLERSRA